MQNDCRITSMTIDSGLEFFFVISIFYNKCNHSFLIGINLTLRNIRSFYNIDQMRSLNYKQFVWLLLTLSALLILSSCASTPRPDYALKTRGNYVTASWYGPKFNGRPTSSGERYDMYAMTCAHKTLKFGSKLRVTNPDNNKSVIVTVNDRGPFIRGRDLDLSYGAAKKIDILKKGVARVKMEHIK